MCRFALREAYVHDLQYSEYSHDAGRDSDEKQNAIVAASPVNGPATGYGDDGTADAVEDIDRSRDLANDVFGHELRNKGFEGGVLDDEACAEEEGDEVNVVNILSKQRYDATQGDEVEGLPRESFIASLCVARSVRPRPSIQ